MEITEVRIKLIDNPDDRLRGFCSITIDDSFVVRDLKIIEGNKGPFVAMPSRKLTSNCHKCRSKNHLRANYCNLCGAKLRQDRIEHDAGGRAKLYADVAHPVNAACRELIQSHVVHELNREQQLSAQPGYASRYDDDYFDDDPGPLVVTPAAKQASPIQSGSDQSGSDQSGADQSGSDQSGSDQSGSDQSGADQSGSDQSGADQSGEKPSADPPQIGVSPQNPAGEPTPTTRVVRFDLPEKSPHKTHKPDDNLSESQKSPEEGFGKGVFE